MAVTDTNQAGTHPPQNTVGGASGISKYVYYQYRKHHFKWDVIIPYILLLYRQDSDPLQQQTAPIEGEEVVQVKEDSDTAVHIKTKAEKKAAKKEKQKESKKKKSEGKEKPKGTAAAVDKLMTEKEETVAIETPDDTPDGGATGSTSDITAPQDDELVADENDNDEEDSKKKKKKKKKKEEEKKSAKVCVNNCYQTAYHLFNPSSTFPNNVAQKEDSRTIKDEGRDRSIKSCSEEKRRRRT